MTSTPFETDDTTLGARPAPSFDRRMLESLICPVTHQTLTWDAAAQELISKAANLAFPVRDGIPIMLVSQARSLS